MKELFAAVPPMGWNSWNTFGEEFDEKVIKQMADVMADEGYLDCGYEYRSLTTAGPRPHAMRTETSYLRTKNSLTG